jgi:hypothetical protein
LFQNALHVAVRASNHAPRFRYSVEESIECGTVPGEFIPPAKEDAVAAKYKKRVQRLEDESAAERDSARKKGQVPPPAYECPWVYQSRFRTKDHRVPWIDREPVTYTGAFSKNTGQLHFVSEAIAINPIFEFLLLMENTFLFTYSAAASVVEKRGCLCTRLLGAGFLHHGV